MKPELVKENEKGKTFQAEDFKILYRNKDSISGDNSANKAEVIYLITGSAEITLKQKVKVVHAPAKIVFPEKTYHKIKAITDISMVLF